MKTLIKVMIAVMMLALPLAFVLAQETIEPVSPNLSGTFSLTASSGSFADDVLTLGGLNNRSVYFFSSPRLSATFYTPAEFAADWAVQNAEASAVLVLDELTALVNLKIVNFDSVKNTISFEVVSIEEIVTLQEVKGGPAIPAQFGEANLTIKLDAALFTSLRDGYFQRSEDMRNTQKCPKAPNC
jgi:hypothetical protein